MSKKDTIVIGKKYKTYYADQTSLALRNFPFSHPIAHKELVYATAEIKEATALAHLKAGELQKEIFSTKDLIKL